MKKYGLMLLFAFLLLLVLPAFVPELPEASVPAETSAAETVETEVSPVVLSKLEVQQLFLQYAQSDWILFDCIPVTDSAYGIVGVVQYTTENYDGCKFDFLRLDGPLHMGVGARPAGEDRLIYMGGDTVSCELLKENGDIYTCTISYYEEEAEIGFRVVG